MENDEMPRVVCAWCKKVIEEGDIPESHGICNECRALYFPEVSDEPE